MGWTFASCIYAHFEVQRLSLRPPPSFLMCGLQAAVRSAMAHFNAIVNCERCDGSPSLKKCGCTTRCFALRMAKATARRRRALNTLQNVLTAKAAARAEGQQGRKATADGKGGRKDMSQRAARTAAAAANSANLFFYVLYGTYPYDSLTWYEYDSALPDCYGI